MFADDYIKKNGFRPLINEPVDFDTGLIVVIPCYLESEILKTLESLAQCEMPASKSEIVIVVNHPENADENQKKFNQGTVFEIDRWICNHPDLKFPVYVVGPVEFPEKWAGVGLARKRGMDEALCRFNSLQKPDGLIVSLDADTIVDSNYLPEIEKHFISNPDDIGATVAFSHQTDGIEERQKEGIRLYEKYLTYFKDAVSFTGYPYSMFTVGSAFAVKAGAYVKRGGMNRRKAGEDFYFLQNLALIGKIGEIKSAKVHPSARISTRVPFGTGVTMKKWMNGDENLRLTYNFNAFCDLKRFFNRIPEMYRIDQQEFNKILITLPVPVSEFLKVDSFWTEIDDLNKNCSRIEAFCSRFYQKFNAFKILKFLNFVHERFYSKDDIEQQSEQMRKLLLLERD